VTLARLGQHFGVSVRVIRHRLGELGLPTPAEHRRDQRREQAPKDLGDIPNDKKKGK
jgi:hypothetical protein